MSTKMDRRLRQAFDSIDFAARYKQLSKEFDFADNGMKKYANDKVLEIIRSLGHEARYMKNENFFMIVEEQGPYRIQFNISCKYGAVELIFDFLRDGERIEPSGIWDELVEMLTGDTDPITLPAFRNYDDLQGLLTKALGIYDELKKQLLNKDS